MAFRTPMDCPITVVVTVERITAIKIRMDVTF
jgi:hypothetical protein